MRTDNPSLGEINCDGCESSAHIKRKRNGKKLLYLHCPNCGLDQRSGAKLQAKWQAAIDGITETQEVKSSQSEQITEQAAPVVAIEPISRSESSLAEWRPESEKNTEFSNKALEANNNDNSSEQTRTNSGEQEPSNSGFGVAKVFGTIAGIALLIGKARA